MVRVRIAIAVAMGLWACLATASSIRAEPCKPCGGFDRSRVVPVIKDRLWLTHATTAFVARAGVNEGVNELMMKSRSNLFVDLVESAHRHADLPVEVARGPVRTSHFAIRAARVQDDDHRLVRLVAELGDERGAAALE